MGTNDETTGSVSLRGPGPAVADPWAPGHRLGRYVILDTLGEGGMGRVFGAYDRELDRAVALKVLLSGTAKPGTDDHTRLMREAQAMARLSHPNVVAVHDVTELDGRICLVMEKVDGASLRGWMGAAPRSWHQVLDVFMAAGEGLAAAHAAQMVHRDFKPDNVLIGVDGRVRVTDFGIALFVGGPATAPPVDVDEESAMGPATRRALQGTPLTQPGQVPGTPKYMAPEQFAAGLSTAQTDQFAFCLALYEALYGQLPFAGDTHLERRRQAASGAVRSPPAGSRVPAQVHRVLVRGLSADAIRRYPAMKDLLHALGRARHARRRTLLAAAFVGSAVALASGVGVLVLKLRPPTCDDGAAKLQGVWDASRRAPIRQAFLATGLPYAAETWVQTEQALDDYASRFRASHLEACRATYERGDQSVALLDLRMACLARSRSGLAGLVGALQAADKASVANAKRAIDDLPSLAACADAEALVGSTPRPATPQVAREVEEVRQQIAEASAVFNLGKRKEAVAIAERVTARAKALGFEPLQLEAAFLDALAVRRAGGSFQDASQRLKSLYERAYVLRHDEMAARAASSLASRYARDHQVGQAEVWIAVAAAANQRAKVLTMQATLPGMAASVAESRYDYAEAERRFVEARKGCQPLGETHRYCLSIRYNEANMFLESGKLLLAREGMLDSLSRTRAAFGAQHPLVTPMLAALGQVSSYLDDPEKGQAYVSQAMDFAPDDANLFDRADGRVIKGDSYLRSGDLAQALAEFQAARAGYEGSEENRAYALKAAALEGLALVRLGRLGEAQRILEGVVEDAGSREEAAAMGLVFAHAALGELALARGRPAEAIPSLNRAIAASTRCHSDFHPLTLEPMLLLARAQQQLGKREEARQTAQSVLERATKWLGPGHSLALSARVLLAEGHRAELLAVEALAQQLPPSAVRSQLLLPLRR